MKLRPFCDGNSPNTNEVGEADGHAHLLQNEADYIMVVGALELNSSAFRGTGETKIPGLALVIEERQRTILLSIPDKIYRAVVLPDHVRKNLTAVIGVIA